MSEKFVLTGLGRCGSNLLKFALKQHPKIYMVGEYFNRNVYPESADEDGASRAQAFFDDSTATASGFKIFVHHGRKEPQRSVWEYLGNTDIRVIYLTRENYFQRILSWKVADARGQWLADDKGTDDIRIDMPPEEWESLFELEKKKYRNLRKRFANNHVYELTYEGLIANWEEETKKLQGFLKVPPMELEKSLKKQESISASERCPNYGLVSDYFLDSEYSWMFS